MRNNLDLNFIDNHQMLIITSKDIASVEEVTLKAGDNCGDGIFFDISDGDLYIQTPRLNFEHDDRLKIFFGNEKNTESVNDFYMVLRKIEERVCMLLSENSDKWFASKLSLDVIMNDLFKSCIRLPDRIGDPLYFVSPTVDDFEIYDTSREQKSLEDMKNVRECTFLLRAKDLYVNSNQANINWEVVQVLIHRKKAILKGFGIREESRDKVEVGVIGV